jgi:Putative amidoligase enzyme
MREIFRTTGPRISRSMKSDPADVYDSWGIELVSPVYRSFRMHFNTMRRQVRSISDALTSNAGNNKKDGVMALCSPDCGLHVHIGNGMDIVTLRYVGLLLVVYEDEILRLVPQWRRDEVHRVSGIMSNRQRFLWDMSDIPTVRQVTDEAGSAIEDKFTYKFQPLNRIRDMIFKPNLSPADKLGDLQDLMGGKHRLVNFSYLARNERPRTLEFRQHEGTLDPKAIEAWVRFCIGLVQFAWDIANARQHFPVHAWDDRIWIEDLFIGMNLEACFANCFRRKIKSFGDNGEPRSMEHYYVRCPNILDSFE